MKHKKIIAKIWVGIMFLFFLAAGSVMAGEMTIEKVWPQKLYCAPKENQTVTVTVKNSGEKTLTARLLVELRSGFEQKKVIFDEGITLAAKSDTEIPVTFSADPAYVGWEAVAILKEWDKTVSEKRDYFVVAATPWQVAHGNGFIWSYGLNTTWNVASWRDAYCCIGEQFGFGNAYVGRYLPDEEEWISNCGFRESKSAIRGLIAEAHKNGIKVTAYVWNQDFGPAGWEFARKHPEWVLRDKNGNWVADYNVELLDKLEDDSFRYRMRGEYDLPGSDKMNTWYPLSYDWHNLDVVKHHASELIRIKKEMGYDGFRYDCELSSAPGPDIYGVMPKDPLSSDEMAVRNHDLVQEIVRKAYPDVLFGYNYGARQTSASPEKLKAWYNRFKGNFVLFEDTVALWSPDHEYHNWKTYRAAVKDMGLEILNQGGYYYIHLCRAMVIKTPLAYEYQAATGFASRAHLNAVSEVGTPAAWDGVGVRRVNAFALRFADQIFDPALKDLPEKEKKVTVSADNLWWKEYVYTHKFEGQEEWLIHLINPPLSNVPDPAMKETNPPVKNVVITLNNPGGGKIAKAWAISPDTDEFITPLEVTYDKITLPELKVWSVICVTWR